MASPAIYVCFVCQEDGNEEDFNSHRLVCCGNSVHRDCHNSYVVHNNTSCGLCRRQLPGMSNEEQEEEEEEEEELVGRYVLLFSTRPYICLYQLLSSFLFSLN